MPWQRVRDGEGLKQRIADMTEFLNEQTGIVEGYDEQMVRRLVERVPVYEGSIKVEFKSGTNVHVKYE